MQSDTKTKFPIIDLAFHLLKCGSLCCQGHVINYRLVHWNVFFWQHAYFRALFSLDHFKYVHQSSAKGKLLF